MKSLIVGDINSIYLREFASEIMSKRLGCEFDILSLQLNSKDYDFDFNVIYPEPSVNAICGRRISNILSGIRKYRVCRKYDEIIVLYVDHLSFSIDFYAKPNARIVLCFYGSDLLRASRKNIYFLKRLVDRSSRIVVENEYMKSVFDSVYGNKNGMKVRYAHYGTNNATIMQKYFNEVNGIEYKKQFGLDEDKLQVLIGYNGSRAQQHLEVIESLDSLPSRIKKRIAIVIHCAYGFDEAYIKEIEDNLISSGIEYKIITDFMTGKRLAEFRASIDIMIHWQTTDCMSASMVENMESGTIVINGEWLKYPDLKRLNAFYETASDKQELADLVGRIANHFDEYKVKTQKNQGILSILEWNFGEWNEALSS